MKTVVVAAWLTTELLRLPGSHAPGETREEYVARAQEIGTDLAEEATPYANGTGWTSTEIAAAGAVIWYGETLLDKRIQLGEPHPLWNQDHGLARCGMQLHTSGLVPQDMWERLVGQGADSVRLCAHYGLRVVVAQARQCGVFIGVRADRNRVAKMLASYASGGKCVPNDRDWQRADLWLKMMATRPDNEKKTLPGYRRVGPSEIPSDIVADARRIVKRIDPRLADGERAHVGDIYSSNPPHENEWKYVVERHAEGKIGVSVFVKE
jgi:hypothetical protein